MSDEDLHHCENECAAPPAFPMRPKNRPGLDHVTYRVGGYASIREALLYRINQAGPLQNWTHRLPDDPAIALLEGAAIVGDILAFYQEHYANEAWLRTAQSHESIIELVRLLGYRLSPALGGKAAFTLEVKGLAPVTVPAGFPFKADLVELPAPAEFETSAEHIAYPHLSKFHLYRPRKYAGTAKAGTTRLELASAGYSTDLAALSAVNLKKGDLLMLVPPEDFWKNASIIKPQPSAQAVKITKVTAVLDRVILELEGSLAIDWNAPISAYRIGRTFKHFGHQAPEQIYSPIKDNSGKVTGTSVSDRLMVRTLEGPIIDIGPKENEIWLDPEVKDLAMGSDLIIETMAGPPDPGSYPLTVARRIEWIQSGKTTWELFTGAATRIGLDKPLTARKLVTSGSWTPGVPSSAYDVPGHSDLRDFRIHETTSPQLHLRPAARIDSTFDNDEPLAFFGTQAQAQTLKGRRVIFQKPGLAPIERFVAEVGGIAVHEESQPFQLLIKALQQIFFLNTPASITPALQTIQANTISLDVSQISSLILNSPPHLWALRFNEPFPALLLPGDFDESTPTIEVFGNVVDATQGRTEAETPLGNGDARATFQTFKLPKSPLTYHLASGQTPAEAPELAVYVAGRRWQRAASFYGHAADEQIYIVREDPSGDSYVQFGDGLTGARLPSGLQNVSARWRRGNGAHGAMKPGADAKAAAKLDGLDKVHLPGLASGGSAPETGGKARDAAPGRVQSLGRIVSLRDYETELLAIPGIVTCAATWDDPHGVPSVVLRVLLEEGRQAEADAICATIAQFQHCRGSDRFPIVVQLADYTYIKLAIIYAFDATFRVKDVEAGMRAALGLAGDDTASGLFSLRRRRIGAREYASRIEGLLQNVPGVRWCRVTLPAAAILKCAPLRLLQLRPSDLTLTAAADGVPVPCAS